LKKQLLLVEKKAIIIAKDLHAIRAKNSVLLSVALTKGVQALKMLGATLKYTVQEMSELDHNGLTRISFIAETNPGEGFHSVKSIASGGELSRILLTLRQIVSTNDSISVFLFDEIDTGVGGETALCVGKALKAVSKDSQVITITHLPQIAANADALIHVKKEQRSTSDGDRTMSVGHLISSKKRAKFIQDMTPIH